MPVKKNETEAMSLTVTEGLTVTIRPDLNHEFLMTTKEVANGYGISEYTLRRHKMEHSNELINGKHFTTAVQIMNGDKSIPVNSTLWTKRGVVRLGFFIKSERAKLFRDWAEDLIVFRQQFVQGEVIRKAIDVLGGQKRLADYLGIGESTMSEIVHGKGHPSKEMIEFVLTKCQYVISHGAEVPVIVKRPALREYRQRNTQLTSLLIDVCKIEDTPLRMSILNKLMGGAKL